MINIPVSIGELYDKYTILEIKKQKMVDIEKLEMIDKELKYLKQYTDNFTLDVTILNKLRHVNKTLWDIEDNIREKEINILLKSSLFEIKSYSNYK